MFFLPFQKQISIFESFILLSAYSLNLDLSKRLMKNKATFQLSTAKFDGFILDLGKTLLTFKEIS